MKSVEILSRDRVVLVVMALRAADAHSKENRTNRTRQLVEVLLASDPPYLTLRRRPQAQESRCSKLVRIIRRELVPSKLFLYELVVRLVVVERIDNVVAVAPDVVELAVGFAACRVRVTR